MAKPLHASPEPTMFPAPGVAGGIQRAVAIARQAEGRPSARLPELGESHARRAFRGARAIPRNPDPGLTALRARVLRTADRTGRAC